VYPDLAHSLIIKKIKPRLSEFDKPKSLPRIGINPMPMYDSRYWCVHDQNKYYGYINKIVQFVTKLIENNYPFFFFGTQRRDNDVITDILSLLKTSEKGKEDLDSIVFFSNSVKELIENILSANIVVATRFHGTVLSLLSERPLISICYYRKSRDLMNDMQQEDYAVDFENFAVDEIWKKLKQLESNLPDEIEKIRAKNFEYRLILDKQYDLLFKKN
jgi:polysaccharide pyruvyl transferase WcaK-like protein